jgi:hypothetical protein
MAAKSTELARQEETALVVSQFPLAPEQVADMREIVQANLGDSQIRPFDLERIKVPGSGGKFWEVTDTDGAVVPKPEFEAIILHHSSCRQYYASEEISGQPPDCYSDDMRTGIGTPGGACETCPLNQWDTGKKGVGKACQEKRKMFLLMPGRIMPALLMAPTGSLKPIKDYFLRTLTTRGVPFFGAVTAFGLSQETSQAGTAYSAIHPRLSRLLAPEEKAQVKSLIDSFAPLFKTVSVAQKPAEREPGEEG